MGMKWHIRCGSSRCELVLSERDFEVLLASETAAKALADILPKFPLNERDNLEVKTIPADTFLDYIHSAIQGLKKSPVKGFTLFENDLSDSNGSRAGGGFGMKKILLQGRPYLLEHGINHCEMREILGPGKFGPVTNLCDRTSVVTDDGSILNIIPVVASEEIVSKLMSLEIFAAQVLQQGKPKLHVEVTIESSVTTAL